MKLYTNLKILDIIAEAASDIGIEAFVIGGFVRDLILKRNSKDIDIVAAGSGIDLAKRVSLKLGKDVDVKIFKNFGTAMLRYGDMDVEFVGARKESYNLDSRKPVVENGSIQDDQNRRDFTINALAICIQKENFGEVIDPFNGLEDLKNGIIRTPLDAEITFSDDPLRMLRAIRFATQLNFTIEEKTFESILKMKERISIISRERIADELNKIILSKKPSIGFELLKRSGLLELIFPEMLALSGIEIMEGKGHKDNFNHTLEVLDKISMVSDNLWLRWTAILHDIAKPVTKKFDTESGWTFHGHDFIGSKMVSGIFRRLKLPMNEKMKYVEKLVQLHLRPISLTEENVTDSAIRRLLFDAGQEIDDLMLLCGADVTSKNPAKVKRYLKNFEIVRKKLTEIEEKDKLRNWQPPVDGELIMKTFNIKPCREVGIIKEAIREAILDGIIGNTFEEAYQLMLQEGEKLGLKHS
ncbi:MAG TPA: HD domain-containing protein [Bacteroidales bacterium]|nr:HD domain-containing protein [Bacteroidales bacterium]HPS17908.1 HD domain-containing protein [Bacteroidales bacterium]